MTPQKKQLSGPLKLRYFSPTEGRSVPRYGTKVFIGALRTADGMEIDPTAIVALPERETLKYAREYARHLREGDLIEYTAEEALEGRTRTDAALAIVDELADDIASHSDEHGGSERLED